MKKTDKNKKFSLGKFSPLKTVQFIVFLVLTAASLFIIFSSEELYHLIAQNTRVKLLCGLLWASLGLSFLFMFIDFSTFSSIKRDYGELDFAVHSDPLTGIANRYSCDAIIEKYTDKPVPEDLGCVMIEISNIGSINKLYGHSSGNTAIRNFSNILTIISADLCFVGRNGGNMFLAIFESEAKEKTDIFLARLEDKIKVYNSEPTNNHIEYSCGIAPRKGDAPASEITDLIALSSRRLHEGR